jgi:hypothetical protein
MRRKRASPETHPGSKRFLSAVTGILLPYADRPGPGLDTVKKLPILKHDPSLGNQVPEDTKDPVLDR